MTRSVRVLLVDDSSDLRLLVRRALEAAGPFEVVGEAADGAQALQEAARTRPDLVLLDLAMPTMSGLQALPHLREVAPAATVVVLSVYQCQRIRDAVRARGAVGYLEKGVPARQFVTDLVTLAGVVEAVDHAVDEAVHPLDGERSDVPTARRFVGELLCRHGCEPLLDRVSLLTSEVVGNAVLHAGGPSDVRVRLRGDVVRVEVRDADPRPVCRATTVEELGEGGRGLLLVEELASRWGIAPEDDGKTVWFEVPRVDAVPAELLIR